MHNAIKSVIVIASDIQLSYKLTVSHSSIRVSVTPLLAGRSLYWLAKTAGLPYWTVHKIANNKTNGISFNVLEKLCNALECEPCELIVRESLEAVNDGLR